MRQRRMAVQDVVSRKLQDWKAHFISMAGRRVLIQAVVNAIPQHYILSAAMPISAIMDVEKSAPSFLWNGTLGQPKIHTISWDVVTQSKAEGGLGYQPRNTWTRLERDMRVGHGLPFQMEAEAIKMGVKAARDVGAK
ncbi:hypothetical protein QJS04_geneDACA019433 [Acorus gramineus]|uniref:Uncharacterized protein n=1 Tax=Acorus gramineus TaxID=55184 RepID=A0AAV9ALY5_ACOGR|nr:hypothetical protein QJS04_geneDACA019433 [Acorus gramineus]